jgi:hypothetical protein
MLTAFTHSVVAPLYFSRKEAVMWTFFFILALIGVMGLLFYLLFELNELEKKIGALAESLRKHYEVT